MRYALLFVLLTAVSSVALTDDERLEHVLVSVPIHKKTAETALPVTALTGEELRRAAAATLGETLENQPGLANASFGPGVGRPVIRGQQGPRTITLQNGTTNADVSGLSPDHNVTVESLLADSIEVLRGPSTLLYGGGAIGGVVNVMDGRIPRSPTDGVKGALEYRYGEAAELDSVVVRMDAGNGQSAWHLSGTLREFDNTEIPDLAIDEAAVEEQEELEESLDDDHGHSTGGMMMDHEDEEIENTDGYLPNTDGEASSLTGGFSHHFGERGFAGFSVSYLETEYGIPPGAHGHHEDEDEDEHEEEEENVRLDLEQTRYDAQLHWHDVFDSVEVVRAFLTYTDYQHDELEGDEVGTSYERETWESRLELTHKPLSGLHGVVGLQWRQDEFTAIGDEGYLPETDSLDVGLFVVEDYHRDHWTYEFGARIDYAERDPATVNADSEDFMSYSFSASALWDHPADWRMALSLSRNARAPVTEELYSNADGIAASRVAQVADPDVDVNSLLVVHAATGSAEVGDPDLDEEVSNNLDLSIAWERGRSWGEVTLFYNVFEDYIHLYPHAGHYDYDQEDAEFMGFELDSRVHLADVGSGALSLDITGDYVVGEFDKAGDVPRLPPLRLGAKLQWQDDDRSAWLRAQWADEQDSPGEIETPTDGYTRWDLGADYRWRVGSDNEVLAFLKWKNINDEEIRLSTSFLRNYAPEAGRSIEAGVRFSF